MRHAGRGVERLIAYLSASNTAASESHGKAPSLKGQRVNDASFKRRELRKCRQLKLDSTSFSVESKISITRHCALKVDLMKKENALL